jgi:nicotinamide riboside kinase
MAAPRGGLIAIVGAESTGKSTLALALADRIAAETGLRCAAVPEVLREWCDAAGRTPHRHEQLGIATEQQRRIDAARAAHDMVVADTTPLMVALYSLRIFGDESLLPMAIAAQRGADLTLLTALDLPWRADGHQRDGPHVRAPVDGHLRRLLTQHGIGFATVSGEGDARVAQALDAATPLLARIAAPGSGLFTRLAQREAAQPAWQWVCDKCDLPDCEHALRAGPSRLP